MLSRVSDHRLNVTLNKMLTDIGNSLPTGDSLMVSVSCDTTKCISAEYVYTVYIISILHNYCVHGSVHDN